MSVRVEHLKASAEPEYSALVGSHPAALIYASLAYREFLRRVFGASDDCYLAAYAGDVLIGCLPAFRSGNGRCGYVINSLPFFGSHGDALALPGHPEERRAHAALIGAFRELARERGVMSATLITNPLAPSDPSVYALIGHTHSDRRIGQITELPTDRRNSDVDDDLMGRFHQKTRNMVRKGQKGAFTIRSAGDDAAWAALSGLHEDNMRRIGGMAKPPSVFSALRSSFTYDRDYCIYLAERDARIAAALLVLYFNGTAEYFTPAIDDAFRSEQPLTAVIFHAMRDAVRRGCSRWNWGGTWLSQEGVYRFKSRWGARDLPYSYYTVVTNPEIAAHAQDELKRRFPYFYVMPYAALSTKPVETSSV